MLGGAACRTEMDHEPINEIDHVYKKRVEFCLPSTYFRDFVLAVYLLWTWSVSLIGSWSISVRHAPPPQSENQTGREATGREPLPAPQPTWISDRNGDASRRSNGDSISIGDPSAIRYPSRLRVGRGARPRRSIDRSAGCAGRSSFSWAR